MNRAALDAVLHWISLAVLLVLVGMNLGIAFWGQSGYERITGGGFALLFGVLFDMFYRREKRRK